jgi:hypothetical protein
MATPSSEDAAHVAPKFMCANVPVTSDCVPPAGRYLATPSPSATLPGTPPSRPMNFSSLMARVIRPLPQHNFHELTNTGGRNKENVYGEKNTSKHMKYACFLGVYSPPLDHPSLPVSPFCLPLATSSTLSLNDDNDYDVFGACASLGLPIQLLSPLRLPHTSSPTPLSPSTTIIGSESPEKRAQDALGLTGGNG